VETLVSSRPNRILLIHLAVLRTTLARSYCGPGFVTREDGSAPSLPPRATALA